MVAPSRETAVMSSISTFRNNRTPTKNSSSSLNSTVVFPSCSTSRKGGRGSCTVHGPLSGRTCTGRGGGYGSEDHEPQGNSLIPRGSTLSGTCANQTKVVNQFERSLRPVRRAPAQQRAGSNEGPQRRRSTVYSTGKFRYNADTVTLKAPTAIWSASLRLKNSTIMREPAGPASLSRSANPPVKSYSVSPFETLRRTAT